MATFQWCVRIAAAFYERTVARVVANFASDITQQGERVSTALPNALVQFSSCCRIGSRQVLGRNLMAVGADLRWLPITRLWALPRRSFARRSAVSRARIASDRQNADVAVSPAQGDATLLTAGRNLNFVCLNLRSCPVIPENSVRAFSYQCSIASCMIRFSSGSGSLMGLAQTCSAIFTTMS